MSVPAPLLLDHYDALVFDLGGVILDLDFSRTIAGFSALSGSDASSLYTQMEQVPLFDRFERGEIGSAAFRSELCQLFGMDREPAAHAIDAAWNALLGRIPDEKLRLLQRLGRSKRVFLLSNTNEIHIEQFFIEYQQRHEATFGPWSALFEHDLYSHRLGMRKPEPRIFEQLATTHGLVPERSLFIDDNPANVRAASALGFRSVLHATNTPLAPYFPEPGD